MTPCRVWGQRSVAFLLLLSLLNTPASAGSADDPEIQDGTGDQQGGPLATSFPEVDVVSAWVDGANETDTSIEFVVALNGPVDGTDPSGFTRRYEFQVASNGQDVPVRVTVTPGPGGPTLTYLHADHATLEGNRVTLFVIKTALGGDGPLWLTNLSATASLFLSTATDPVVQDRAPDEGAGRDYQSSVAEIPEPEPGPITPPAPPRWGPGCPAPSRYEDNDDDGLEDGWECNNFSTLELNASDDPDRDGCDNLCEMNSGGDPIDPRTPGDTATTSSTDSGAIGSNGWILIVLGALLVAAAVWLWMRSRTAEGAGKPARGRDGAHAGGEAE